MPDTDNGSDTNWLLVAGQNGTCSKAISNTHEQQHEHGPTGNMCLPQLATANWQLVAVIMLLFVVAAAH